MAPPRAEARTVQGLSSRMPAREARRVARRGLRLASLLNSGSPDEEVVRFVCDALSQEGDLVQELVEELALRLATPPSRTGPSPTAPPRPGTRPGQSA